MEDARPEPTDSELRAYVKARLDRIGRHFAEPDAVDEALEYARDLWRSLYEIDRELDPDPSSRQ